MFNITVPKPKPVFTPITITINTEKELADLVGALSAYGKGVSKAKKSIREAGLGQHYSGNARLTARSFVTALAKAAGFSVPVWPYGLKVNTFGVATTNQS